MQLRVPLAALLVLAGCSDELVSANGNSDTGTNDDELPMVECDELPREFTEPVGIWRDQPSTIFELDEPAVAAGGDVVWVTPLELGRWDRTGQPLWTQAASEATYYSGVGLTAIGELVVAGRTAGEDPQTVIERFDQGGILLERATFEHTPNEGETAERLAVSAKGNILAELRLTDRPANQPQWQLIYIDSELQERFVHTPTERFHAGGLAFDVSDRGYALYMGFAKSPPDSPNLPQTTVAWPIDLRAFDEDGSERWVISDELLAQSVPRLQLAAGDRVYVYFHDPHLAPQTDSLIRAYEFDGTLAWELFPDYYLAIEEIHAITASPCGGLYVVGLADRPDGTTPMSIWSIDSNGSLGPTTPLPEEHYGWVRGVRASPLDEVIIYGETGDSPGNLSWMVSY